MPVDKRECEDCHKLRRESHEAYRRLLRGEGSSRAYVAAVKEYTRHARQHYRRPFAFQNPRTP